jgi:HEAT repeat protein
MTRCTAILSAALAIAILAPGRAAPQAYLGKSPAEWQRQLTTKDPRARRDAAFALGKLGRDADDAVGDLLKLLQGDSDKGAREAAAYSLGQICRRGRTAPEVLAALCKIVSSDGDGTLKRSCAVALGYCASDSGLVREALGKALEDKQFPGVRQNAAWALGEICLRSEALPLKELRKGLQDEDKLAKRDAALALGKILSPQIGHDEASERQRLAQVREQADKAVRDLLACATHDYLELRKAALGALANLPLEEHKAAAVPVLAAACNNDTEDLEVRVNAALCLANIGGEEALPAVPVLRSALKNGDIELKRLVALTLRQLGPTAKPALDDLCRAMTHPDLELRMNAAYGLGGLKFEGHDAVPDLVKVVCNSKEDYRVRVAAAMSLQTIGGCEQATKAMPDLVRVLDDPKQPPKVRERVLWALRVHKQSLKDNEPFIAALKKILTEPGLGSKSDVTGAPTGKMLRYDSAFLVSVLKGREAPDEALDVLKEFLHDNSIRIYKGVQTVATSTGSEGSKSGPGKVIEKTSEDGRIMAIDALGQVGNDRVQARQAIVDQLRAMSVDNSPFEPNIQKAAKELLQKLGG